uniref:phosphoethanolamine N-methyltransferase n=1 Tax=Strongyloides papillosus TaxID=174720 RepID=A0A0N5CHU1_STREA
MSSIKHELVLSALKVIRPTRCLKSLVVSAICLGEGRTIESIYIEELTKQYGKEIAKNSEIEYTRDVNSLFNKRHSDKDLIILCDIITTNYSIERNFNCELLLEATVNCLKENGFIIIKENLRQHEGPLLTKINKLLQESYLVKFHEMNQLRYSIYMEGNFLDIYWILSREDKAFTDKKIFQFFNFIEEYSLVKADVKAFSGKEFFHFIDYNEKEHWNLLDRFESLKNGALMLQLGFTYLHLQTVVRYNNILFLMSPYTETIIDNLLYNQRAKDNRIFYILANFHLCTYSSNYYDVLFVPNFLHYNANYEKFFNDAFCCLKNGGEILITTLVIGPGSQNQEFEGIVKFYRLFLKTESEILNLMEKNGFSGISSEKMTDMLSLKIKKILSNEPSTFTSKKATFLNTYIQSKNLEFVLFYGKK